MDQLLYAVAQKLGGGYQALVLGRKLAAFHRMAEQ